MKICKDGRIWGQNNKEAGEHLGISIWRKKQIKKGNASEVKKGNKNPMYGRHHTLETRRQTSDSMKGDKNPSWKGGIKLENDKIRHRIEFRLWREAVLARDNWTCRKCSKRGGRLEAHHIKPFSEYPELRFAIDNGETLCLECHKLTDNYCGKGGKRK